MQRIVQTFYQNNRRQKNYTALVTTNGSEVIRDGTLVIASRCTVKANSCVVIGDGNKLLGRNYILSGNGTTIQNRESCTEVKGDPGSARTLSERNLIFLFDVIKNMNSVPRIVAQTMAKPNLISDRGLENLGEDVDIKDCTVTACSICLTNRACVSPDCRHLCLCGGCAKGLQSPAKCPICRRPVSRFNVQIFA